MDELKYQPQGNEEPLKYPLKVLLLGDFALASHKNEDRFLNSFQGRKIDLTFDVEVNCFGSSIPICVRFDDPDALSMDLVTLFSNIQVTVFNKSEISEPKKFLASLTQMRNIACRIREQNRHGAKAPSDFAPKKFVQYLLDEDIAKRISEIKERQSRFWQDVFASGSVFESATACIEVLDELLTSLVNCVITHERFSRVFQSWFGLRLLHLIAGSEHKSNIYYFDLPLEDLRDNHEAFFKKLNDAKGIFGSNAPNLIVGNYQFGLTELDVAEDSGIDDLDLLSLIGNKAQEVKSLFVSSPDYSLFGFKDAEEFSKKRTRIIGGSLFESNVQERWTKLRQENFARHLCIVLAEIILPFEANHNIQNLKFRYRFDPTPTATLPLPKAFRFCSAMAFAAVIVRAYRDTNWILLQDTAGTASERYYGGAVEVGSSQDPFVSVDLNWYQKDDYFGIGKFKIVENRAHQDRTENARHCILHDRLNRTDVGVDIIASEKLQSVLLEQGINSVLVCPRSRNSYFDRMWTLKSFENTKKEEETKRLANDVLGISLFAPFVSNVLVRNRGNFKDIQLAESKFNEWLNEHIADDRQLRTGSFVSITGSFDGDGLPVNIEVDDRNLRINVGVTQSQ